ncbi:MAG: hypothetical protein K8L99_03600 [Anaerolineae bacterium]|nr:hypothetical protein [Anaerolineae bacterium]
MRHSFLITLTFLFLIANVVSAQEGTSPDLTCTFEGVEPFFENWDKAVTNLGDARNAQDINLMYETFLTFDLVFDTLRSMCNPLAWEGSGDKVLDPVFLDAGIYKLVFTGERNDVVTGETISGECFAPYTFIDADQTQTEEIFRSSGCTMLFQVDAAGPWTVTFERVS